MIDASDLTEDMFFDVERVKRIHAEVMARYEREPQHSDEARLASAVDGVKARFYYESDGDPPPDLFDYAASYMHKIAESQAFVDGNKRTALTAGLTFLRDFFIAMPEESDGMCKMLCKFAAQEDGSPRWTTDDCARWLREIRKN